MSQFKDAPNYQVTRKSAESQKFGNRFGVASTRGQRKSGIA
jgi:hypothetical protein